MKLGQSMQYLRNHITVCKERGRLVMIFQTQLALTAVRVALAPSTTRGEREGERARARRRVLCCAVSWVLLLTWRSPNGDAHDHKRSRACEACRGLKVRCDMDLNTPNEPCKRCKKAGRQCIVTQPSRRRQKKSDTRVAELERKIDALTAVIAQQNGPPYPTQHQPQSAPDQYSLGGEQTTLGAGMNQHEPKPRNASLGTAPGLHVAARPRRLFTNGARTVAR